MRRLNAVVTNDAADHELLKLANEKGKFALQLGLELEDYLQSAFERGIDQEWFTLVDLSEIAEAPQAGLMRVFRLTESGRKRLDTLAEEMV
jgi:hypothetical protein